MMQFIIKCLLVFALAYAVLALITYTSVGRLPKLPLPEIPWSWFSDEPQFQSINKPNQPAWRWRENGRWHYGEKPPEGVKAERIDHAATQ